MDKSKPGKNVYRLHYQAANIIVEEATGDRFVLCPWIHEYMREDCKDLLPISGRHVWGHPHSQ